MSVERFAAKLDARSVPVPEAGCVLWTGSLNSEGYGHIGCRIDGRKFTFAVHRLSYEIANGPIPDGLCVLHRCDVRSCIAPRHLFLGTKDDNNKDRVRKGRSADVHGERNPFVKYTDAQIAAVRADTRKTSIVAAELGSSPDYVRKLRRGEIRAAKIMRDAGAVAVFVIPE